MIETCAFCTLHCNIIVLYKPTKYSFLKLNLNLAKVNFVGLYCMIETYFETQSKAWVKAREYACQVAVLFQISVTSGPVSQEVLLYILPVQHFYKYFGCVAERKYRYDC